jgi:hypothetical protein
MILLTRLRGWTGTTIAKFLVIGVTCVLAQIDRIRNLAHDRPGVVLGYWYFPDHGSRVVFGRDRSACTPTGFRRSIGSYCGPVEAVLIIPAACAPSVRCIAELSETKASSTIEISSTINITVAEVLSTVTEASAVEAALKRS